MKAKTLFLFPILLIGALSFGQDIEKSSNFEINGDIASNTGIKSEKMNQIESDTVKEMQERDAPWFVERFRLSAGFYKMFNNTSVKISPESGEGADVDFENDLGFNESSQSFIADFEWRSSSRSKFNLTYYNSERNASKRLEKTIVIGDNTYDIDTEIYAYMNSEFYRLSYGYAILSKPKYEAGLLIGTHTIATSIGVGAKLENGNLERNEKRDFTAPLIDFGIWGGYAISDRFALRGELNYFQLKIDTFDGKVLGYNFNVMYKAMKNLEFSTGFAGLNFEVDVTDERHTNLQWGYNGITLMAAYTFGNKKWK